MSTPLFAHFTFTFHCLISRKKTAFLIQLIIFTKHDQCNLHLPNSNYNIPHSPTIHYVPPITFIDHTKYPKADAQFQILYTSSYNSASVSSLSVACWQETQRDTALCQIEDPISRIIDGYCSAAEGIPDVG